MSKKALPNFSYLFLALLLRGIGTRATGTTVGRLRGRVYKRAPPSQRPRAPFRSYVARGCGEAGSAPSHNSSVHHQAERKLGLAMSVPRRCRRPEPLTRSNMGPHTRPTLPVDKPAKSGAKRSNT